MASDTNSSSCCPQFNPKPWDGKTVVWKNKLFITGRVLTCFCIPLNFGAVITRMMKNIEKAKAVAIDGMCLSDHTSKWIMNLYIPVDKEIPKSRIKRLSGTFYMKVYEGDYQKTNEWHKDFQNIMNQRGLTAKKTYMWYTTCPKCAKKFGKNYTVIVGQV